MARVGHPHIPRPTASLVSHIVTDEEGRLVMQFDIDGKLNFPLEQLVDTTNDMYYHGRSNRVGYPMREQEKKVEKRFTIPSELFEAIDFSEMGIQEVEDNYDSMPKFIIGEKYALRTPGCDGFEGTEKIYKLIGFDDEFGGVKIDALIVKQIAGEVGNIYTLSKNDCDYLGIEYETGLQLFPKKLSWIHVKDVVDFDKNNLVTTPTSDVDNTIRHIVLRLDGFTDYSDGYVLSPSGKLIKEEQFERSIMVESNEPIVYGNGYIIQDHTPLDAHIVHPSECIFNHGNFISSDDEVFIHINLKKHDQSYSSFDNCFGVEPKYLDGINPNEFFTITWDELGGMTVEEYEELKKKRAKEEEERAKREEEERKRQIEEAEKAIAEQRRLETLAVERMKKFRIREPKPIPTPTFNMSIDPIVGIGKYIDDLDDYFNAINDNLLSINNDLINMRVKPFDFFGSNRRSLVEFLEER